MRIVKETLGGEKTQLGAGDLELIHRLEEREGVVRVDVLAG